MSVVCVKSFSIKFQLQTEEIDSVGNFPISLYYSYYRYII